METLKLNKVESEALSELLGLRTLSLECLASEQIGLSAFGVHVNRKCPNGNRGKVITGLMAEVVAETDRGWQAAVNCLDFRKFLKNNYNKTPEIMRDFFNTKSSSGVTNT